jgi:anthranilate synthase component II
MSDTASNVQLQRTIVLIDNYDSFTYNLAEQLHRLIDPNDRLVIFKNDEITAEEMYGLQPACIVISPGPGNEQDGGICLDVIARAAQTGTPLLGICLGHQLMVHWCGGKIIRAMKPIHGHAVRLYHDRASIFSSLSEATLVGRYHSLVACSTTLPSALTTIGWSANDEVMAVAHNQFPWVGLQFHPESFLTDEGDLIVGTFLSHFVSRQQQLTQLAA